MPETSSFCFASLFLKGIIQKSYSKSKTDFPKYAQFVYVIPFKRGFISIIYHLLSEKIKSICAIPQNLIFSASEINIFCSSLSTGKGPFFSLSLGLEIPY